MKHIAKIAWEKSPQELFTDGKYSRLHKWEFDGGLQIAASSSPHVVSLPFSVESAIDPEEAFIASISSCHMLFFLSIAAAKHYVIERYIDNPEGIIQTDATGITAFTEVKLKPKVHFSGTAPDEKQIEKLHDLAHKKCFIANSVKSTIKIEII